MTAAESAECIQHSDMQHGQSLISKRMSQNFEDQGHAHDDNRMVLEGLTVNVNNTSWSLGRSRLCKQQGLQHCCEDDVCDHAWA